MSKKGDIRYSCDVDCLRNSLEFGEYRCRSIRKGISFWTLKSDHVTWGKLSKTPGDFGWLDPIDPVFRERCAESELRGFCLSLTKTSAAKRELAKAREGLRHLKDWYESDEEIRGQFVWEIKRLKKYIARWGSR